MKITFAPCDKIDDFAHELIKNVFGIKGALMTNESPLFDFVDFGSDIAEKKILAKVGNKYKVSMENYPKNEPLYVWRVARFVQSKLRES